MKQRHRVIALLASLAIITYLDRVCIAVAGPRMQDALGISPQAWGWVMSAFFISYSLFEIPSGMLGDRIGPRRVITRIVLWWSAFTALTGAASSYSMLLIVRFCFGMGEAGAYPNIAVVISRWTPAVQRARIFGIVWMMSQAGGALAPLLVVPLLIHYGWQSVFYLFGALGVLWSAVWYWWFRDSPREKAGITPQEIAEIGVGPSPVHTALPWNVALRSGNLWRFMAIAACYVYVLAFFQSWFQTFLVKGRGFTEVNLVLSSLPYLVGIGGNLSGGIASDWLARRLGLKQGRRLVGVVGLGVSALGMLGSILTTDHALTLVFISFVYLGITFQQPAVAAFCLDIGGRHSGAIFGFMNTAGNGGAAIGAAAFGHLVHAYGSYTLPLIPMCVALSARAVLWLTVDPTRKLFGEEPANAEETRTEYARA